MTMLGPYYRDVDPTPSAQYSITIRAEIEHRPGMLGRVATAIGDAGGTIGTVELLALESGHSSCPAGTLKPSPRIAGPSCSASRLKSLDFGLTT